MDSNPVLDPAETARSLWPTALAERLRALRTTGLAAGPAVPTQTAGAVFSWKSRR